MPISSSSLWPPSLHPSALSGCAQALLICRQLQREARQTALRCFHKEWGCSCVFSSGRSVRRQGLATINAEDAHAQIEVANARAKLRQVQPATRHPPVTGGRNQHQSPPFSTQLYHRRRAADRALTPSAAASGGRVGPAGGRHRTGRSRRAGAAAGGADVARRRQQDRRGAGNPVRCLLRRRPQLETTVALDLHDSLA